MSQLLSLCLRWPPRGRSALAQRVPPGAHVLSLELSVPGARHHGSSWPRLAVMARTSQPDCARRYSIRCDPGVSLNLNTCSREA